MKPTLLLTLLLGGGTVTTVATASTLICIPVAEVQEPGTGSLEVSNCFTASDGRHCPLSVNVTWGLAEGRAEAGVIWDGGEDESLVFHAKYLLSEETATAPAWAVGMYGLSARTGVTDQSLAYLVATRTLGDVRVTAGYGRGNPRGLGRDPDMLLLGLDGYLTADDKWWGVVDYQSGRHDLGALSCGVSYALSEAVSVLLGYMRHNDRDLEDTLITQLSFCF